MPSRFQTWVISAHWHLFKGGTILASGLSDQAVYAILKKRGETAGLSSFTPHDIRRTFAGDLLDAGVDLVTVQMLHVPYKLRFGQAQKYGTSCLMTPF